MDRSKILLHYSPVGRAAPSALLDFAVAAGHQILELPSAAATMEWLSRSFPAALVLDASESVAEALRLCARIKGEEFTAVVPLIVHHGSGGGEIAAAALEAGADEVLLGDLGERENELRLALALRRAERDVSVHPTTRLPASVQIDRDISTRLKRGDTFAVCYADIDHFKEFNDRYGYREGDRIILIVSRILRDVVRGRATGGFVGHIGGDDFVFVVPLEVMALCCEEVLETFDSLIPLHYTEEDRSRGFFPGKDRRGNTFPVPLMTLSIGVVTNERRTIVHPAQVSEIATEMKNYAKTLPGSVYAVDRRTA